MSHYPNRREFIKHASLWPLGASLGLTALSAQGQAPAAAPAPAQTAPGRPLKVSLNAYSFSALLTARPDAPARLTLDDVLDFCAKYEFDAIDATGYYFPGYPKPPDDAFVYDFKRRAHQLGLAISGSGVKNNFSQADKALRAADVQLVKNWIEVAAKLGAPVLRVYSGPASAPDQKWDDVAAWMADNLRDCADYGRQHGVLIGVQNHADFLQSADQVLQLVQLVNSPWFGVVLDIGSFRTADPYADIARVTPAAVNFQIKDHLGDPASSPLTDVKKVVQIIRAGGYRGYLPIETLAIPGQPYDPRVTLPPFLQQVRSAIADTA
jgi:sugar phosphate isomerase/epimerase